MLERLEELYLFLILFAAYAANSARLFDTLTSPSEIGWARLVSGNQAFSRARVRVVRSQTSEGPKYWMAPG